VIAEYVNRLRRFAGITRKADDIEMIYVLDFLKMLWNGEIF